MDKKPIIAKKGESINKKIGDDVYNEAKDAFNEIDDFLNEMIFIKNEGEELDDYQLEELDNIHEELLKMQEILKIKSNETEERKKIQNN